MRLRSEPWCTRSWVSRYWLWILGWQVEERVGRGRLLVMVVLVACVSNTAQYIISGPFFLGVSGVVAGLVGFIAARQRKGESYPLPRQALLTILYFMGGAALLGMIDLLLRLGSIVSISLPVANTAHLSGLAMGYLLGQINGLSRRVA